MIAFLISTIPRALLASVPNQDGLKIAAALLAKNIGGGINYMAVCSCLNASPESIAAGLCVDNVMALVYFPLVSLLASKYKDVVDEDDVGFIAKEEKDDELDEENGSSSELSPVESLSHAFTLAALLTAGGQFINSKLHYVTTSPLNLSLPITTLLTVIFSTYYSPNMLLSPMLKKKDSDDAKSNSIAKAGETLGTSLLYLFFATAGAPGWRLKESIQQSFPSIATFLIILYGVHGATLWSLKKLVEVTKMGKSKYWKKVISPQRLLTASSAAIGGPATAAALAQSNQWDSLLTPSLLVGNVGYAIATFIGLLFYGAANKLLV